MYNSSIALLPVFLLALVFLLTSALLEEFFRDRQTSQVPD